MAIQQTKKHSDLEKRLQILRRQVYGRESAATISSLTTREARQANSPFPLTAGFAKSGNEINQLSTTDISYLRQDLFKICLLSTLAIGSQITLFILSQKHLVSLKFF